MDRIQIAANRAAKIAIQSGRVPASARFFVQRDGAVYSLWHCLWGNESELIEVLEDE